MKTTYDPIFKYLPVGISIADKEAGKIQYANDALLEILGRSYDEVVGVSFMEFTHPDDRKNNSEYLKNLSNKKSVKFKKRYIRKDGSIIHVSVTVAYTEYQDLACYLATLEDETDILKVEKELKHAEQFVSALADATHDIILGVNSNLEIVFSNSKSKVFFNKTKSEMLNKKYYDIFTIDETTKEKINHNTHMDEPIISKIKRNCDGNIFDVEMVFIDLGHHNEYRYAFIIRDITSRLSYENKIKSLAFSDSLTGLKNRAYCTNVIEDLTSSYKGYHDKFAIHLLDLDLFKHVNDSLGHDVGDKLLIEVAKRLKMITRASDVVSRFGGDEFCIIQKDTNEKGKMSLLANRCIQELSKPFIVDGHHISIGCSIGISVFPDDGCTVSDLVKASDLALYSIKDRQRGAYMYFEKYMREETIRKKELENKIEKALLDNQFYINYQPIVELSTGRIVSCEALIRWNHPIDGIIPPSEFIPLAEDRNLIMPITYNVIDLVCQDLADIIEVDESISVGVNIPASALEYNNFVKFLKNNIDSYNLCPSNFNIEITETKAMQNVEMTTALMKTLIGEKFTFSIDDFGTGYSSLAYLYQFQFNKLKIDKSFIDGVPGKPEKMVKSIIQMAKAIGVSVVAEGIETKEQLEILKNLKCELGQGYYFSKPLSKTDFINLLRSNRKD